MDADGRCGDEPLSDHYAGVAGSQARGKEMGERKTRDHMHPVEQHYLDMTRRRFFGAAAKTVSAGLGSLAFASLLAGTGVARSQQPGGEHAISLPPHFMPKAKRIIYMHMEGAPSQLDLFDYKPQLAKRFNEDLPD
jgi:hypothetical protein